MTGPPVGDCTAAEVCAPNEGWDKGWRRGWGLLFAAIWLAFLIAPAMYAWDSHPEPLLRILGALLVIAFVVVYLISVTAPFDTRRSGHYWPMPLLLFALSLAWIPLAGETALSAWVFVAVAAHATLSVRHAVAVTVALILGSAGLLLGVPGWDSDAGYPISILAASMAMFGVIQMAERNRALVHSQHERARSAALEERERLGRDLHDILGHSLTVIAVKSELAGRLVDRDPAAAAVEIADIERLAREALADVRSTVAGVREISLVSELSAARTALLAAGIEPDLPVAVDEVPGQLREVYGYLVREAVTNVVRHSGAASCVVRLGRGGIEVVDDGVRGGVRPSAWETAAGGSGLVGLRQRVEDAGLHLEAGQQGDGGFRVAAVVVGDSPGAAEEAPAPAGQAQRAPQLVHRNVG